MITTTKPTICHCQPGKCSAPKPEWCIGRRYADGHREPDPQAARIAELEARLRPGVSTILNELIAADFAHVNPVTGEITLTLHGQVLVDRAKADLCNSTPN